MSVNVKPSDMMNHMSVISVFSIQIVVYKLHMFFLLLHIAMVKKPT